MSNCSRKVYSASNDRRRGDRRKRRLSLVWPERRTGFDRRAAGSEGRAGSAVEYVVTGLRDSPAAIRVLLLALNILNLADFALTMNALAIGGGEANPIMRSLFDLSPVYAGVFKVIVIFAVSLLIWRLRRFRSALQIALVLLVVFVGLFLYHIVGLIAFC
jgi:hypothetical protein